jgi:hypothetical protein
MPVMEKFSVVFIKVFLSRQHYTLPTNLYFAMNCTIGVKSGWNLMPSSLIELRNVSKTYSTAAGEYPVEVIAIPHADFARVMKESPITAEAVGKIVQAKLETQRVANHRTEKA